MKRHIFVPFLSFLFLLIFSISSYAGVFVTPSGKKFHLSFCETIVNSKTVDEIPHQVAVDRGYTMCGLYLKNFTTLHETRGANGDPTAYITLGVIYQYGDLGAKKDFEKAYNYYNLAIQGGSPYALARLGLMYQRGEWIDQDYKQAFRLYTKAAERGSGYGYRSLAIMYSKGLGVEQNHKEAFRLRIKALLHGESLALIDLALASEHGQGTPQSYQKAYEYFYTYIIINGEVKIINGEVKISNLERYAKHLSKEQIHKAEKDAILLSIGVDKMIRERTSR